MLDWLCSLIFFFLNSKLQVFIYLPASQIKNKSSEQIRIVQGLEAGTVGVNTNYSTNIYESPTVTVISLNASFLKPNITRITVTKVTFSTSIEVEAIKYK